MSKISTQLPSDKEGGVKRVKARLRRVAQMESLVGVPEPGTRWVPLTRNEISIVDEEDYDRVNEHIWFSSGRGNHIQAIAHFGKSTILMSRFIMNAKSGEEVDHINHDTLDNRRSNLRLCSHAENHRNLVKFKNGITSKFKGVCFDPSRKKYRAYGVLNYKQHHIGRFDKELDAATAYNAWASEHHGEFACLNVI